MRSTFLMIFPLAAGLGACLLPAPPPAPPPPEMVAGAALARPTAALLEPFAGRYTSGGEALTVTVSYGALIAERAGSAPVPLRLVGRGTFADPAGSAYLFAPATGGAATRLTVIGANRSRRDWNR